MLLQAMLGLQHDAPRGKLYVDPVLPNWLPDVTLTDLRLGQRHFDIRFWRNGKDTVFKVLKGKKGVVEQKNIGLFASRAVPFREYLEWVHGFFLMICEVFRSSPSLRGDNADTLALV